MTVSTNINKINRDGDGVTVAFDLGAGFIFFLTSELRVLLKDKTTGAETLQTITTDYTVSGGAGATGTVTFVTAPTSNQEVIVLRIMPLTQSDDLVNNDTQDAEVVEDALDKIVLGLQQLDEADDRALKLPESETNDATIPAAVTRRGKVAVYDDDADALPNVAAAADLSLVTLLQGLQALNFASTSADKLGYFTGPATGAQTDLTAFARTLLDDANAAAVLTTLGVSSFIQTLLDDASASAAQATLELEGRPNLLVDGGMQISQAGTLTGQGASAAYTAIDMWKYVTAGSPQARFTTSQYDCSAELPGTEAGHTKALKIDVTTAEAAVAAGEFGAFATFVEAQDLQHLLYGQSAAKTLALSFYIKSPKSGTHCLYVQQNDAGKQYIREFTVATANTWEKITLTVPGDVAGTINDDTGAGLEVGVVAIAGSDFQASADSWIATGDFATSNQQNLFDNTANDLYLTGVKSEVGSAATDFDHAPFVEVFQRVRRYYRMSYTYGTAPGTATLNGSMSHQAGFSNPNLWNMQQEISPPMRGAPTLTWYSTTTGNAGQIRDDGLSGDRAVSSTSFAGDTTTGYPVTSTSPGAGGILHAHFVADVRL